LIRISLRTNSEKIKGKNKRKKFTLLLEQAEIEHKIKLGL